MPTEYFGDKNSRAKVIEAWAANVIVRWEREMRTQDIENPDRLMQSLRKRVINAAGGDQTKVFFFFALYGKFLDLGVGRGEKYENTKKKHDPIFWPGKKYPETPGYKYQVKPWFLAILRQRVYSLTSILERKYNEYAEIMLIRNIAPEKFLNGNTNPL